MLASALGAYGAAFRDADPVGALNALGRGLVIAQDSGNRAQVSILANRLALLEAEHGDTVSVFDHLTLAIRNYHNCGNITTIRVPLAVLAALFDRLGRYEPAATIAGCARSPIAAAGVPEITTAITHLREVLGEATYESLARKGETMTTAAMATYAYDQIDQARTELNTLVELRESRIQRESSAACPATTAPSEHKFDHRNGVIVAGCLADPQRRFEIFHGSVVSAEHPFIIPTVFHETTTASVKASALRAITKASSRSSRHPQRPNHHRAVPRRPSAAASGDPTMRLPFVGSPSAHSMVASDHRNTSISSPVSALTPIAPKPA